MKSSNSNPELVAQRGAEVEIPDGHSEERRLRASRDFLKRLSLCMSVLCLCTILAGCSSSIVCNGPNVLGCGVDPNLPTILYTDGPNLPPGQVGQPYSQPITASVTFPDTQCTLTGCTVTLSLVGGSLPNGLAFNPPVFANPSGGGPFPFSDALAGTPTTAGTFTFSVSVRAVDSIKSLQNGLVSSFTVVINSAAVPPAITTHPADQLVTVGQTATFTVVATGTAPLSYQWQKNGATIPGAPNSASYTTPATTVADNGSTFRVIVSNVVNPPATSNSATLTVNAPVAPTITVQPMGVTVTAPATATFSVTATGTTPLNYQWQNAATNANIAGATSSNYTTPATTVADNGSTFRVIVSNGVNPPATSNPATLTVNPAPSSSSILAPGGSPSIDDAGDTIVAVGVDLTTTPPTQVAFVFVKGGSGGWTRAALLTNVDNAVHSVAISRDGTTAVVGSDGCVSGPCAGHAFVYVAPLDMNNAPQWSSAPTPMAPTAMLTSSDLSSNGNVGYAVSTDGSGDTVAVGAPGGTSTNPPPSGAVYVFVRAGVNWTDKTKEDAKLTVAGAPPPNCLGISVSLSSDGTWLAVGATSRRNDFPDPGAVFVFQRPSPGGWTTSSSPKARLTASDPHGGDLLGIAVSISGDGKTIVAGASTNPITVPGNLAGPGAAYVFVKSGTDWATTNMQDAKLTVIGGQHDDRLGQAVAVSTDGGTIVVGAPNQPFTAANNPPGGPGAAYVFVRPGSGWAGAQTETSILAPFDGSDQVGQTVTYQRTGGLFGGAGPNDGGGVAIGWSLAAHTIVVAGQAKVGNPGVVESVIYLF